MMINIITDILSLHADILCTATGNQAGYLRQIHEKEITSCLL